MGTVFRKLGSEVYIIEMKERILPEIEESYIQMLKSLGYGAMLYGEP